jgi:hypothetical protein
MQFKKVCIQTCCKNIHIVTELDKSRKEILSKPLEKFERNLNGIFVYNTQIGRSTSGGLTPRDFLPLLLFLG